MMNIIDGINIQLHSHNVVLSITQNGSSKATIKLIMFSIATTWLDHMTTLNGNN